MHRLTRHIFIATLILLAASSTWAQPRGGPLPEVRVQADPGDSLLARDVGAMMRAALAGYPPGELPPDRSPIIVQLAADPERFKEMAGGRSPEWAAGIVLERGRTILVEKRYLMDRMAGQHLLRHELAHVLLDRHLKGGRVPRWFHEGFAQVHAGEWDMQRLWRLSRAAWTRTAIPLAELRRGFPYSGPRAQLAYAQSQAGVQNLRKDLEAFEHLLELLGGGTPFSEALRRSQGMDLPAFEEHFDHKIMPGYRRLSLLFSTGPLFFMMMIIFLFAAWRRRRAKRRAKDVAPEEWYAKGWIDKQWPG